ncbi:uncharacterized protein TRIADDRAFT_56094 [Trichoplax adhaerens]|uniref:Protein NATD1 n=1 Tax=Trichoplax adhaerens TaxID=10228 RepID=B3RTZ0_TRIAD|nr:hypothetical protein TRIADDRAFT_56094 [Trichoplax adhaerens]EDV26219.1 hypothetical protein TRIADDRAFT_56094 [Trichoplax adhaerens]|eukprot:XP_002112252.1 hypothetical protein TRIADDRAFT_56094 [Trichoplax adhaerens]
MVFREPLASAITSKATRLGTIHCHCVQKFADESISSLLSKDGVGLVSNWAEKANPIATQLLTKKSIYTWSKGLQCNILNDKAVLQYSLAQNEGVIDMLHTGVPPRFRGMGVAKLLAQTAFDYALQNRFKMKLSCWYLAEYLQKNPKREYEELVLK